MKKMVKAILLPLLILAAASTTMAAVTITSPQFGVSQEKTFDITLATDTASSCRHSSPFRKSFDEMTPFDITGSKTHALEGFELPAFGQEYDFFVNCNSGQETGEFKLKADNAAPAITSVLAEPEKVVEPPLETKIKVETNEKTSCKYDETEETYEEMSDFISGSDTNEANYKTSHEKTLTGLEDEKDHSLNVRCRDLSGRLSGLANVNFEINTSAEPEIINFTPANGLYTSNDNVFISITTNKKSTCKYGNETPPAEEGGTFNIEGKKHEANLQLEERTHTYHFTCVLEGPKELTAQTTFTIDKTAPAVVMIDDNQSLQDTPPGKTYRTDRLKAEWQAIDAESGIKQYNYSITSGFDKVVNWTTTTSDEVTVRGLQLKDGRKYTFRVKAQNNAGLWSEAKESPGVTVDISLNPEQACRNGIKDGDETDTDCGGSCSTKCPLEEQCLANSDCTSGYCSEGKCAAGSCEDGIRNQEESDVDCGGSCKECQLGNNCNANEDCESGVCIEGICATKGACFNGMKDGTETGIDCGGVCAAQKGKLCQQGKGCAQDEDCTSNTCGIDGKCAPKNDRDYDTVLDSKDNCPAAGNPTQLDSDNDGTGDECDEDNDNDGMTDVWEKEHGLNHLNAADAERDEDGDGLTNLREFSLQTNPRNPDSDGDGHSDAKEAASKTNPNDAKSNPGMNRLVLVLLWMLVIIIVGGAIAYLYYKKLTKPVRKAREEAKKERMEEEMQKDMQIPTPPERRIPRMQPPQHSQPQPRRHVTTNVEDLREEHAKLSGEEVFRRLKRHTRK